MDETILVQELGQLLEFSYTDMLCYAGPFSRAGVASALKVLQRAFAALSPNHPPQRRAIIVRAAFDEPGIRDGIEAVTRAVTDGRYTVDPGLVRPDRGRILQGFAFQVTVKGRTATLLMRPGFITDEFFELTAKPERDASDEAHLDQLNIQLARQLLAASAEDVYELAF
ncbi:hypothetical protein A5658_23020 [Mycobacterium sp. 1245111.1]|uniref:hypothetical protein n=1 Tax=Mycobacterium sp. 1245111.1 TaxID=1834073 RepID=UPI00080054B9|nr:hypothetical protein [Mycobacterium sp. 1245111.1]OBK40001.1 hypothetical protein A5658_23020 [Mycobacterium sp. 1245111.1]